MVWIVSLIFGSLLIKLGAMSVLLTVMATTLKAALVVIILLVALLLWRRYRDRRITWKHYRE